MDASFFTRNRKRLRQLLLPNAVVVVNANDLLPVNADALLRMEPNSDLLYLSGIAQEESILVLAPQAFDEQLREVLFLREPNEHLKTWEGHKLSKEEASAISGIRTVKWLSEFRTIFHQLMCDAERVYLNTNEHKRAVIEMETRDARFIRDCQQRYPLHEYHRLAPLMHRLRIIKQDQEVEMIRHAGSITEKAYRRICRFVRPGINEADVEAEFAHEFIRNHARFAYTPIVASGSNACVLHYIQNDRVCRDGELLLLDVAASYGNYRADVTRTIPVNGRFTRRQRQVYEAVLRVLRESIARAVPGKLLRDWQKEAEAQMTEELLQLKLLKPRDIKRQDPNKPACKRYFMHGLGHPLGLDTHDVGYTTEPMAAGWVITVEPGIYIPEEGIGVRLENDILITGDGPVDLTPGIPLEADEIESIMGKRKRTAASER